jgi:membrane-associated phospholipid phosphatase
MNLRDLDDILILLGGLIRAGGTLVFGVGAGWLVLKVVKEAGKTWQLIAAAVLGLLGTFLVLAGWGPSSITTGAFGLGVGGALLGWGLWVPPKPKPKKKE